GKDLFRSRRLPDIGRLIRAAGDNPPPIRGKGHSRNRSAVPPLEREQFFAVGCIPDLSRVVETHTAADRLIRTAGDTPLPIGGYGHSPNRAVVPLARELRLAGERLPDLGRLIRAAGDNSLPVLGKRHGPNLSVVPLEREQFLAGGRFPDL